FVFFFLTRAILFSPSETSSSQSPNFNKCHTKVLSLSNKAIVSWSGNVKKLTPDLYSGICFGKFYHYSPIAILCWNKTTETFSFLSQYDDQNFKNPQVKIDDDGGGIEVSVEVPLARNTGQTVFWDVQWVGMHNRVIDEMLFCFYKVESPGCGSKVQKTVLGTKTKPGGWPWQVSIKHQSQGHWCGGSVIDQRWIITAAHCFDGQDHKDFTVVAGDHHLNTSDGFEQDIFIRGLYKHPRHNINSIYNYDVALLKLNTTLQYNDRVLPVCLPKTDFATGWKCFVTGWGKYGKWSTKQNFKVLKQAKLPLVSRITCKRRYRNWHSFGYRVTKRMRCAGYPKGGDSVCNSDVGGPLVCEKNRKWYLMGVASWSAGCGRYEGYGVYADVLKLKKWIRKTIQYSQ
ncbi:unnamed protein product, partial [Porites lobata]